MRRLGALVVVMALALPAGLAVAGESADYRDDFGSGGYSGNDGSLDFDGPWTEFGDSGGASSGLVHVGDEDCSNNECVHIEGPGLVAANFGIERSADLSRFESAELSYDIFVEPGDLLGLTHAQLRVLVRSDGSWTNLASFNLKNPFSAKKQYSLDAYLADDFAVRFVVPGLLGGEVANWSGYATIDRVEINGYLMSSTTTTSSTSSTTSTTRPKPSTSSPASSTSTSTSTTSSTSSTTSTIVPGSTAANRTRVIEGAVGRPGTTTTTVVESTTSTTDAVLFAAPTIPPGSGLRDPGVGLMTDYESGMMGDMEMESVEVLGAELDADFSLAVEYFEAGKLWIALLALVIGAAFVGSLDRRRLRRDSV